MEMEMEIVPELVAETDTSLASLVDRITAAATLLEDATQRFNSHIREAELESLLAEANATIATLKAGRKTHPGGLTTLAAKDGSPVEANTLDTALASLSMEQRFAVKAQLLRSGLIG